MPLTYKKLAARIYPVYSHLDVALPQKELLSSIKNELLERLPKLDWNNTHDSVLNTLKNVTSIIEMRSRLEQLNTMILSFSDSIDQLKLSDAILAKEILVFLASAEELNELKSNFLGYKNRGSSVAGVTNMDIERDIISKTDKIVEDLNSFIKKHPDMEISPSQSPHSSPSQSPRWSPRLNAVVAKVNETDDESKELESNYNP